MADIQKNLGVITVVHTGPPQKPAIYGSATTVVIQKNINESIQKLHALTIASRHESGIYSNISINNNVFSVLHLAQPPALALVATPVAATSGIPSSLEIDTAASNVTEYGWRVKSAPLGSAVPLGPLQLDANATSINFNMSNSELVGRVDQLGKLVDDGPNNIAMSYLVTAQSSSVSGQVNFRYLDTSTSTSDRVSLNPNITLSANNTYSFWFYNLRANNAWRAGGRSSINYPVIVQINSDNLGLWDGAFRAVDTGFQMPQAAYQGWHHIVAISDGTNQSIYVDGVLAGTVLGYYWRGNVDTIANHNGGGQAFSEGFDEWGIWNRSLSSIEVSDLYNKQKNKFVVNQPVYNITTDFDGNYDIDLIATGSEFGETIYLTAPGQIQSTGYIAPSTDPDSIIGFPKKDLVGLFVLRRKIS